MVYVISKAANTVRMAVPGDKRFYDMVGREGREIPQDFLDKWLEINKDSDFAEMLVYPGHRATRHMTKEEYGGRTPLGKPISQV